MSWACICSRRSLCSTLSPVQLMPSAGISAGPCGCKRSAACFPPAGPRPQTLPLRGDSRRGAGARVPQDSGDSGVFSQDACRQCWHDGAWLSYLECRQRPSHLRPEELAPGTRSLARTWRGCRGRAVPTLRSCVRPTLEVDRTPGAGRLWAVVRERPRHDAWRLTQDTAGRTGRRYMRSIGDRTWRFRRSLR